MTGPLPFRRYSPERGESGMYSDQGGVAHVLVLSNTHIDLLRLQAFEEEVLRGEHGPATRETFWLISARTDAPAQVKLGRDRQGRWALCSPDWHTRLHVFGPSEPGR